MNDSLFYNTINVGKEFAEFSGAKVKLESYQKLFIEDIHSRRKDICRNMENLRHFISNGKYDSGDKRSVTIVRDYKWIVRDANKDIEKSEKTLNEWKKDYLNPLISCLKRITKIKNSLKQKDRFKKFYLNHLELTCYKHMPTSDYMLPVPKD